MSGMETGIKVGEAMTRKPFYVSSKTTLAECALLMKEKKIGSLLVKDEDALMGILTEADIVRKAVAVSRSPAELTAGEVMETKLVTIDGTEDIFNALNLMKKHDIRHLPVTSDNKSQLHGFITVKDILKIEPELFELMVDKLDIREEELKPIFRPKPNEGICPECGEYAEELLEEEDSLRCAACRD